MTMSRDFKEKKYKPTKSYSKNNALIKHCKGLLSINPADKEIKGKPSYSAAHRRRFYYPADKIYSQTKQALRSLKTAPYKHYQK